MHHHTDAVHVVMDQAHSGRANKPHKAALRPKGTKEGDLRRGYEGLDIRNSGATAALPLNR
jgi:hypothetical protein